MTGSRANALVPSLAYGGMSDHVFFAREEGVGVITLNRPEKLNAFAGQMRVQLAETLREASDDANVRVLVITGAGRAFCAGADIEYMRELVEKQDWQSAVALVEMGATAVTVLTSIDKP